MTFLLCGTFVGFAHLQVCLRVNLQIRRQRQWHQILAPPRQRSQKNENNQQMFEATEEGWKRDKESERKQRSEGGGALVGGRGGGPWQTEKWSTGLAFIWAACWDWQEWMVTPTSSIANHHFTTNWHFSQVQGGNYLVSRFYHLVDRVRDAWAACFDLFHLIGGSFAKD